MKYNPALDGLRAFAIAAVMTYHCSRDVLPGGFIGVDIFFVLSGYLITSLLFQEASNTGTIALGRFYLRRAMRLWPPLLAMLSAYIALSPVLFADADVQSEALIRINAA